MTVSAQLKNIAVTLANYFDALSVNLATPASSMPSFEDYVSLLDYSDIYVEALSGIDRAASYSTGALTDTVHQVIAINREFDMRAKTPAQYFADASVDAATDAQNYQDMYGRYFNYFRGTSPEQAVG
jgi:hypothetical protein